MYQALTSVNTKGNATTCIVGAMEMHERLRQARTRAGFQTASDAARRFGWAESAYRHHENGTRGFKMDAAQRYARAFRVPVDWILFGKGTGTKKPVPVVGIIGAGSEIYPIDDGGQIDDVEPMPGLGPEAVAVRVKGDSMYPRYFEGDIIVYDKHVDPTQASGQECVVALADGRRLVKVVRVRNSTITLESYNSAPIENASVEWCAPVLWVKRA